MTHRLALFGATGRMGRSVLTALQGTPAFMLSGATASASSDRLGQPLSGTATGVSVRFTAEPAAAVRDAEVAVDFSSAAAVAANLDACVAAGIPLVIAVTGLDAATQAAVEAAAGKIAIVQAANTSVGVAVMLRLAAAAASSLPASYDIEISESHHRMKRDAPSGTALQLGDALAAARGTSIARDGVFVRHGASEPRRPGSIGFSVVRAGDIVGVHTVLLAGDDETLEITHRVSDRICFARGSLAAAQWLIGRPAALYGMSEVVGLT